MKSVYLIDFSNFAYKFKSVYTFARKQVNGVDIDISVLVGFIRCLKANMAQDIVIVLDGVPQQSLSILPGYKGQRLHDDINSHISVPKIEIIQFLTKIGERIGKNIKVVCSPGQETDEVISSIVHHITHNLPPRADFVSRLNTRQISSDRMLRYLDHDLITTKFMPNYDQAVIASTDGDFIQLQRWDNVFIDTTASGKAISHTRSSKSTSQLSPVASIAYKAIVGDVSDNIPAISSRFKNESILNLLNSVITTEQDLKEFYSACTQGTKMTKQGLNVIALDIYSNYCKQFQINWQVAFLTFRSYPLELFYPNYDIESTIQRYGLKV